MRWDLFCRVIDNFGDIGVCWRLAADLGARGETVRLWSTTRRWPGWRRTVRRASRAALDRRHAGGAPGEVVVEAFGCDPPPRFVERMAAVVRSRRCGSTWSTSAPRPTSSARTACLAAAATALLKWFFYPGFTPRTGGLLREPGLMAERRRFDGAAWLHARASSCARRARGEPVLLPRPCRRCCCRPWPKRRPCCWPRPGAAQAVQAAAAALRCRPALAESADYDRLLWACDLNFVRGEDSFVRAQWAGAPFVWHIYPQHDGAHARQAGGLPGPDAGRAPSRPERGLRRLWRGWNGLQPRPLALPDAGPWRQALRGAGASGCWRRTTWAASCSSSQPKR
jgi:hypothetical protein